MTDQVWKQPGTLEHAKREAIISALKETNYQMAEAARRLRVGRSTMYRFREMYEIDAIVECRTES
jgi:transcriptional regulator of acetoin/glycerol metabolism